MRVFLAVAGAFAASVSLTARADGADDLTQGLSLFSALEYTAALPHFAQAKTDASLPAADRARAAIYIGIIQLSLGDEENAQRNFADAIRLSYDVTAPPESSPRVARMLDAVRAERAKPVPRRIELRHIPPAAQSPAVELLVEADPEQAAEIRTVTLYFRRTGTSEWSRVEASRVGAVAFVATLAESGDMAATEYFFEASGESHAVLGQAGSASAPLRLRPALASGALSTPRSPAAPPKRFYESWWFWGGVGTAVVAGAVGAVWAVSSRGGVQRCGDSGYGCVVVTVQ